VIDKMAMAQLRQLLDQLSSTVIKDVFDERETSKYASRCDSRITNVKRLPIAYQESVASL